MKVIFMGTPDFAVNTLEKIIEAGHEVMLVVTQPDKPKGRGNTMQFPPVKECAVSHGLEVFQPVKIREDASVEYLKENYGLAVDDSRYVIHYQRLGANLLPEIAVFPIGDESAGQE